MPFGVLSEGQRVVVMLELKGGKLFVTQMDAGTASVEGFSAATTQAAASTARLNQRTFAQNQLMFTGRRMIFYSTLAVIGLSAAIGGLGLSYFNAMQQTRVALGTVITDQTKLNKAMNDLFIIAAETPFQIKDVAVQFKSLYIPMSKFGYSAKYIQDLLLGMMNALSVVGKLTGSSLQRAAVQITHMVAIGRPMGQILQALARDNIPIYQALEKYLHLTGDQLKNVADSGVTVRQVLDALRRYQLTEPGYANQAFLSQTKTLVGAWSTLKDFISQASAQTSGGLFGGIQKALQGVDKELLNMSKRGETLSMTRIAKAFDKQLSPSTHVVINLFTLLQTIIIELTRTFGLMLLAVGGVLSVFTFLPNQLGLNISAMQVLGSVLSLLILLWTAAKIRLVALWIWTNRVTIAQIIQTATDRAEAIVTGILTAAKWLYITALAALYIAQTVGFRMTVATIAGMVILTVTTWAQTAATWAWTAAQWALNAAMEASPIILLITAVVLLTAGLVILYFKWQKFHDIINKTATFLYNHPFLALLVPAVGPIIVAIRVIKEIYDWGVKIVNFFKNNPIKITIKFITSGGGWLNIFKKLNPISPLNYALRIAKNPKDYRSYLPDTGPLGIRLPPAAQGGTVAKTGAVVVGERGPEIVTLPTAAVVVPNSPFTGAKNLPFAGQREEDKIIQLTSIIKLDSKVLAQAVSKYRLDRQASL